MPRSAICIGDGTWGGHVIEFSKTRDTVREKPLTTAHSMHVGQGSRLVSGPVARTILSPTDSLDVWEAFLAMRWNP